MSREIQLTKGAVAIVDDDDYERVNKFKWYLGGSGNYRYAVRAVTENGRRYTARLHHAIAGEHRGKCIDHINGNTLDNRKCNLRIATRGQNRANSIAQKNNSTGVKGVYKTAKEGVFKVIINNKGLMEYLGCYSDIEEARTVFAERHQQLHGEFSKA